jgi:hypothetical protein
VVFVGESEGQPLIVQFDRIWGPGYSDRERGNAVMVEIALRQVDGHGLPVEADWPDLSAIESALVHEFAADENGWRYVVRLYGESLARFCFYAGRTAGAQRRVQAVMSAFPAYAEGTRVNIQSDKDWSAYARFFPDDQSNPATAHNIAPSFRDEPGYSPSRQQHRTQRDDQPWRGEDRQSHPDE